VTGPSTNLWTADGDFQITADGFPGWFADGYEATPLSFAVTDFAGVGVNIGTLTYVYSFVQVGWVVTGYPPLLGTTPPGTYLPLTISQGPAPPATLSTVPNVVGMYYYSAQLALLQAGCLIAFPTFVIAPTVNPGYVTGQSIAAGTQVNPQTLVTITASGFLVPNQGVGNVPVP
jgi:beta-lactam-binding protein with PASTA domain